MLTHMLSKITNWFKQLTIVDMTVLILGISIVGAFTYTSYAPSTKTASDKDQVDPEEVAIDTPIQTTTLTTEQAQTDNKPDSSAIGCIYFNTSKDIFEKQKLQFLAQNPKINQYEVRTIAGFFYNDKLAAVQIISSSQDEHKKTYNSDQYFSSLNGWEHLYWEKYAPKDLIPEKNNQYEIRQKSPFEYMTKYKGINVTDFAASPRPLSSFKDVIESKIETTYRKAPLLPETEVSYWMEGVIMVHNAIAYLPSKRQKELNAEFDRRMNNAPSRDPIYTNPKTIICREMYNIAVKEANQVIMTDNEKQTQIHKNDPSYSVIIICYLPAYNDYMQKKRQKNQQEEEQQENAKKRTLEMI